MSCRFSGMTMRLCGGSFCDTRPNFAFASIGFNQYLLLIVHLLWSSRHGSAATICPLMTKGRNSGTCLKIEEYKHWRPKHESPNSSDACYCNVRMVRHSAREFAAMPTGDCRSQCSLQQCPGWERTGGVVRG